MSVKRAHAPEAVPPAPMALQGAEPYVQGASEILSINSHLSMMVRPGGKDRVQVIR